jgi:F-box-like
MPVPALPAGMRRPQKRRRVAPSIPTLPDDLLCHVLRYVGCAPTLALLREVAPSWRAVVDGNPSLWSNASFKNTFFARPVVERRLPSAHPCDLHSADDTLSMLSASSSVSSASYSTSSQDDSDSDHPKPPTSAMTVGQKTTAPLSRQWSPDRGAWKQKASPFPRHSLALGPRPGLIPLSRAASAGNEWAAFLRDTFFNNVPLHAITLPSRLASALATGRLNMIRPPPHLPSPSESPTITAAVAAAVVAAVAANINLNIQTRAPPPSPAPSPPSSGWLAVHAARSLEDRACPRGGALVGVIRVLRACPNDARWTVVRAVPLEMPIRCGGYGGMWEMSGCLTDLLVRALHKQ